jgi:Crp-like helix-turn-helix domain
MEDWKFTIPCARLCGRARVARIQSVGIQRHPLRGKQTLLARYGAQVPPQKMLFKVSQEVLADMIGTTRPRITFFMNKFRTLTFIEYGGAQRGLQINKSP